MSNRLLVNVAIVSYGLSFFAPVWVPIVKWIFA
jgi:hypothetical protein